MMETIIDRIFMFYTMRRAHRWVCGTTSSMSTSQARDIKNNKKLTILRLRNVSRKNVEQSFSA